MKKLKKMMTKKMTMIKTCQISYPKDLILKSLSGSRLKH